MKISNESEGANHSRTSCHLSLPTKREIMPRKDINDAHFVKNEAIPRPCEYAFVGKAQMQVQHA